MTATADLYDAYGEQVQVAAPLFRDYGGVAAFEGAVSTVKVFEDNSWVRAALEEPGQGRVLVVDGGGSLRCALLGDQLAELAVSNRWAGILLYGCIRDSETIARLTIGVKALATNPRKSVKRNVGERDVAVSFADLRIEAGNYLYADADGVLLAAQALG